MGAQSFIMMFQAGEGWQYGKRRISAMSNEDFNKLTPLKLLQNQAANLRSSLSTIEKSMNDMTPMIETIIRQYGDFLKEVIRVTPSVTLGVTGGQTPQQIVQQTVPSATGSERQALADFLKNLLPNIPGAFGSGTPIIGTGQVQGPLQPSGKLQGPPAPVGATGAVKTGFLAGPGPINKKGGFFQPTGGTRPEILQLQKLEEDMAKIVALQNSALKQMASRHVVERSRGKSNFDRLRKSKTSKAREITLLRARMGLLYRI